MTEENNKDLIIPERPKEVIIALLMLLFLMGINIKNNIGQTLLNHGGYRCISAWIGIFTSYCIMFYVMWRVYCGRNWARYALIAIILLGIGINVYGTMEKIYLYSISTYEYDLRWIISSVAALVLQILFYTKKSNNWFKKSIAV